MAISDKYRTKSYTCGRYYAYGFGNRHSCVVFFSQFRKATGKRSVSFDEPSHFEQGPVHFVTKEAREVEGEAIIDEGDATFTSHASDMIADMTVGGAAIVDEGDATFTSHASDMIANMTVGGAAIVDEEPLQARVCRKKPCGVRENGTFLVDLKRVKLADLGADDNGAWQFTKIEMASGSRESNAQAARPPSLIPTVVIRQAVQPILPTEDPLTISRQNSEREVEVSGESTNVTPTVSDQASGTSTVSNVSSGQTPSNASGTASSLNPDSQGGEQLQESVIQKLQRELKELKDSANITLVDNAIVSLQQLIARPAGLFDPYAVLAALEQVVNVAKDKNDARSGRFNVILRQCRPLINSPALRSILTKLVASKEEAEVAKVVDKAMKNSTAVRRNVAYGGQQTFYRRRQTQRAGGGNRSAVRESVTSRLLTGAVRVWGEVGIVEPPWLVLPLTVEPSKPRLCIDARYLNLWMVDTPFSLDKLAQVPRFVYSGSYMSKLDDKSGYDHLLLTEDSQTYVGFEWEGWWYVNTTLPFGWKNSPFVYQSVGMAAMSYLRNLGVACSLYIDDRLIGELFTDEGKWSRPMNSRHSHFSKSAAETALYITCRLLVALGYTLGLKKCVLAVCCRLRYLGMAIDSNLQAFLIPEEKKVQFAKLRESILALKSTIPLKLVQRLLGKCISFSLAFPGAKFYIREMALAIGAASRRHEVVFSPALRQEVMFWSFLDSWTECIPWRSEKHASLLISTDASLSRWAAVVHHGCSEVTLGDYWEDDVRSKNINVKEMWAVVKALQSLPSEIRDCRLDVKVDNQATIHVWHGRGGRSKDLNHVARMLFTVTIERNISLSLMYVPSALNEADQFSRKLTKADSMLSARCWQMVQNEFGGLKGHNLDLMSLDSNAMRDKKGEVLPHFSPFPTPKSAGVNVFNQDLSVCDGVEVNAYVFPPFSLILPLLRFLLDQKAVVTVVVPRLSPLPIWWPVLKGSLIPYLNANESAGGIMYYSQH
ncbi:hypothetical protein QZH41_004064 [Actinostola sp. cb2023]|nr:hypothetical protein QZH41_004064 [Actinostola sp. cb2023]